jgi:hypothetical protein
MAGSLKFSMVVWSVDADGKRYLGTQPLFFKLKALVEDFRVPTRGFPTGLFASGWRPRLQDSVLKTILNEGGASGPWAGLSTKRRRDKHGREIPGTSYAEIKAKKYPGSQILQRTGAMLRSLFTGEDYVFEEDARNMKWGSSDPVVGYHMRGHSSPTPLPRRMVYDPNARELQLDLMSDGLRYENERGREAGFAEAKTLGLKLSRPQASRLGMAVLSENSESLSEQLDSLGGS